MFMSGRWIDVQMSKAGIPGVWRRPWVSALITGLSAMYYANVRCHRRRNPVAEELEPALKHLSNWHVARVRKFVPIPAMVPTFHHPVPTPPPTPTGPPCLPCKSQFTPRHQRGWPPTNGTAEVPRTCRT